LAATVWTVTAGRKELSLFGARDALFVLCARRLGKIREGTEGLGGKEGRES